MKEENMKLKISELKELRKLKEPKVRVKVISEGGLASHMNHLYDNRGLTFWQNERNLFKPLLVANL